MISKNLIKSFSKYGLTIILLLFPVEIITKLNYDRTYKQPKYINKKEYF